MANDKKKIRIKAENSDSKWVGGMDGKIEIIDSEEDAYLKFFICPNAQPGWLEQPLDNNNDQRCTGNDENCPAPREEKKTGHAMIKLHQKNGIELSVGNGNKFIIGQDTDPDIPDSLSFMRMVEGESISHIKVTTTGEVHLKSSNGLGIKINNDSIQVFKSGTSADTPIVKITEQSIEIFQTNATKTVTIHGNLTVNGNITYTGTCTDSKP